MTGLFSRLFGTAGSQPRWIDPADLQRRQAAGAVLLIDVRQPEEYASPPGHLPGAINVPVGEIGSRATDLGDRGQPIVVVCKTDRRSARAAGELLAAGLRDVAVLRGGTDRWHADGLPLE